MNRLVLLAVVLVLAGCGSSGSDGGDKAAADWPGPPKANANGSVEFASFNEFLAGDGKAVRRFADHGRDRVPARSTRRALR